MMYWNTKTDLTSGDDIDSSPPSSALNKKTEFSTEESPLLSPTKPSAKINAEYEAEDDPQSSPNPRSMFYLLPEYWSTRYEPSFFTVKIKSRQTLQKPPQSSANAIGGRTSHPACYYEVEVLFGHEKRVILRRYSQFRWLYDQLSPPLYNELHDNLLIPPKTTLFLFLSHACGCNEELEQTRQDEFNDFTRDLLQRKGIVDHHAVVEFFELDQCRSNTNSPHE